MSADTLPRNVVGRALTFVDAPLTFARDREPITNRFDSPRRVTS